MFLANRRITLFTFILAAVGYIVRNYDIEGLEALRVHSRVAVPMDEALEFPLQSLDRYVSTRQIPKVFPSTSPASATAPVPSGEEQMPQPRAPISRVSTETGDDELASGLTAAEIMAVWQDGQSRQTTVGTTAVPALPMTANSPARTIRIASFNLQVFGSLKRSKPHVMAMVVQLIRPFDVVALQEIASNQDDLLPELCDRLNQSGRQFDYMIGPRVGRGTQRKQFAILFETSRIETDRYQLYTVDDPQDLVDCEPLVGWFRVKGFPPEQAFTFSLVNCQTEPHLAEQENRYLSDLIQAIEQDGRHEDDWILAGDFGASDTQLSHLAASGVRFALQGVPTNTRGSHMLDNLLFSNHATGEYTGRAGVVDFLRQHNLSIEQALEISDHLPVWAEFTSHEGGLPGRVAR